MNLIEELRSLAATLNGSGIDYALCGGLAMAAHGFVRATEDIDILIRKQDLDSVLTAVKENGYTIPGGEIPLKPGTDQEGMIFRISKLSDGQLLPLDIMLTTAAYEAVWQERNEIIFEEMRIPVISRTGMIIMKRLGGRRKDLIDLEFLSGHSEEYDE